MLCPVDDPEFANTPQAPLIHEGREGGNLLKHIKVRHGDIDQGFVRVFDLCRRRGGGFQRHRSLPAFRNVADAEKKVPAPSAKDAGPAT